MKKGSINDLSGHVKRVRYVIKSSEEVYPKTIFKILATMRCGKLVLAKQVLVAKDGLQDIILIALATMLEKKMTKHLKGCKTCRIARKTMRKSLSKTARG